MADSIATVDVLRRLFEHNTDANRRITERAGELSPAELDAPGGAGPGSIRQTLFHLFDVEWSWRRAIENGEMPGEIRAPSDFSTPTDLWEFHQTEDRQMHALLENLNDAGLGKALQLRGWREGTPQPRAWEILFHIYHHSAHHRSEIAAMLTSHDHSPGDLDFLDYILNSTKS